MKKVLDTSAGRPRPSAETSHDAVPTCDVNPSPRRSRRESDASCMSFYSDVEMAQDEVFAGPTSESLPSSLASFQHRRRPRAESNASWSFYQEQGPGVPDDRASDVFADDVSEYSLHHPDVSDGVSLHRRPSSHYASVTEPLIRQHDSTAGVPRQPQRATQKIYIPTEDLTIVIAGFKTSTLGYGLYCAASVLSGGLGWLLFRWFPRARVRLIGVSAALGQCDWVVVENQWNEFSLLDIRHLQYGQSLSTVFGSAEKTASFGDPEDDDPVLSHLRYLDYRYIRFCYHPLLDQFVLNTWKDPSWHDVRSVRAGIDGEEKSYRNMVFGDNVIEIEEKTSMQLLVDEAFHPFYVFQIASLILWSLDEYYYYAACIFIISAFSIASTLIETKSTMHRLREISRFVCDVRVLRNGFWRYVASADLVPGDVYEITDPNLSLFPCDSILLTGDCIVNESMLTGESVPVSKVPCTDEALQALDPAAASMLPEVARHFLFSGTKIVRARRPQDGADDEAVALAMVVRTGFNTTKGALVRSMLFPKPSGFKFYRDSFYYIGVMAIIAMVGFVVSFINFIKLGLAWHLIVVRALDLITIVVPPALPATLTIGTNFALSRLRAKQVFCISPQRVNVGGKLDVVCFDKTGTLTEDGLDVLGVHTVNRSMRRFTELLKDSDTLQRADGANGQPIKKPEKELPLSQAVFETMATCHSLKLVDGELVGDPLDLKMFEFTGWMYEEGERGTPSHPMALDDGGGADYGLASGLSPSIVRPRDSVPAGPQQLPLQDLGIFKTFEFVSQLRRTSVVVKRFRATSGYIYLKGAPECMREVCIPESFPADYEDVLAFYTHRGYRVIACATKHIPNMSWIKAQKLKRLEAESGLEFAGFIIFENKLKAQTTPVILELKQAAIRTVMCTGDNILTAISVAKECGLIERENLVFAPRFIHGDAELPTTLRWESVDNPDFVLDEVTLLPLRPPLDEDFSGPYSLHGIQDYCMAVTGEAFRWIVDYKADDYLNRVLARSQVFARMSPDEKHELVEKMQGIDYCVCFCGDGANDCGALKAADVGISLSEAEASVAAPFTSRVFDISCVPEVIREGRAALVTSFSCFKYMSLYSAIQFTSVSILYKSGSNLGSFQFLFIDLFLILPIAVFMGWSGPYPVLCPKRPTASLMSRKVLTPLLGQIVLAFILQFICYRAVQQRDWYIPPVVDTEESNIRNSPNTTLFLFSCYQYILSGIVLSAGPPYRVPMRHNYPYVATTFLALLFSTFMLFIPPRWLFNLMELTTMSDSFKIALLGIALAGFCASLFGDVYLFPRLADAIHASVKGKLSGKKQHKRYKVLDKEMRV